MVVWRGQLDGERPLVVLLHGRGSNEVDIVAIADHLEYAAVPMLLWGPLLAAATVSYAQRTRPHR